MSEVLLNELKKDKNITFKEGSNPREARVSIESYDIVLLENKDYVINTFNNIVSIKDDICKELKTDVFSISISDYVIDGLSESNSMLISKESQVSSIY